MEHAPRDSELSRVCDCVIIHYRMESVSLDVYIAHVSPGVLYGERYTTSFADWVIQRQPQCNYGNIKLYARYD